MSIPIDFDNYKYRHGFDITHRPYVKHRVTDVLPGLYVARNPLEDMRKKQSYIRLPMEMREVPDEEALAMEEEAMFGKKVDIRKSLTHVLDEKRKIIKETAPPTKRPDGSIKYNYAFDPATGEWLFSSLSLREALMGNPAAESMSHYQRGVFIIQGLHNAIKSRQYTRLDTFNLLTQMVPALRDITRNIGDPSLRSLMLAEIKRLEIWRALIQFQAQTDQKEQNVTIEDISNQPYDDYLKTSQGRKEKHMMNQVMHGVAQQQGDLLPKDGQAEQMKKLMLGLQDMSFARSEDFKSRLSDEEEEDDDDDDDEDEDAKQDIITTTGKQITSKKPHPKVHPFSTGFAFRRKKRSKRFRGSAERRQLMTERQRKKKQEEEKERFGDTIKDDGAVKLGLHQSILDFNKAQFGNIPFGDTSLIPPQPKGTQPTGDSPIQIQLGPEQKTPPGHIAHRQPKAVMLDPTIQRNINGIYNTNFNDAIREVKETFDDEEDKKMLEEALDELTNQIGSYRRNKVMFLTLQRFLLNKLGTEIFSRRIDHYQNRLRLQALQYNPVNSIITQEGMNEFTNVMGRDAANLYAIYWNMLEDIEDDDEKAYQEQFEEVAEGKTMPLQQQKK